MRNEIYKCNVRAKALKGPNDEKLYETLCCISLSKLTFSVSYSCERKTSAQEVAGLKLYVSYRAPKGKTTSWLTHHTLVKGKERRENEKFTASVLLFCFSSVVAVTRILKALLDSHMTLPSTHASHLNQCALTNIALARYDAKVILEDGDDETTTQQCPP